MNSFQHYLLKWYQKTSRKLPWKKYSDVYSIWLSEVLLQQTRVKQATPYFLKFKKKYPKVQHLAAATPDEVMKLWQGLGYYSRARNMHETARFVVEKLNGQFPDNYDDLLKLKGIGEYTAAAIASFAFHANCAVVDGNVYRVLSRYFGVDIPINSAKGKKYFRKLAQENLYVKDSATYNQAIMDFGATVCTPRKTDCINCPLKKSCWAFLNQKVPALPVKTTKITKKERYFIYLKIKNKNKVYLHKRMEKDIWLHLYQFPLIEVGKADFIDEAAYQTQINSLLGKATYTIKNISSIYKQTLTHQKINARFIEIKHSKTLKKTKNWMLIDEKEIHNFAFPKIIDCFLQDKVLFLNLK